VETIFPKRGLSIEGTAAIARRETLEKARPRCSEKGETIELAAIATPRFLKIVLCARRRLGEEDAM
jgi:hypothetical protein